MASDLSRNEPPGRNPRQPIFNNEAPVLALSLGAAITLISLLQLYGSPGVQDWLLRAGAILTGGQIVDRPLGAAAPFFLHVFLHANLLHLGINMAALLSFGPPVARLASGSPAGVAAFLAFFFACAAAGAALHVSIASGVGLMVGASSGLSGLLAAAGFVSNGWRGMLSLALPWAAFNLVLWASEFLVSLPLAWAAHLGGVAAGVVLSPALVGLSALFRRR